MGKKRYKSVTAVSLKGKTKWRDLIVSQLKCSLVEAANNTRCLEVTIQLYGSSDSDSSDFSNLIQGKVACVSSSWSTCSSSEKCGKDCRRKDTLLRLKLKAGSLKSCSCKPEDDSQVENVDEDTSSANEVILRKSMDTADGNSSSEFASENVCEADCLFDTDGTCLKRPVEPVLPNAMLDCHIASVGSDQIHVMPAGQVSNSHPSGHLKCVKDVIDKRRRTRSKLDESGSSKDRNECMICGSGSKCGCVAEELTCGICSKVFKQAWRLRQHSSVHKQDKTFVCDKCGLEFRSQTCLRSHKARHAKAFKCDVCGRAFGLASALKYHLRTHTGERPFQCDTCGMTFTSAGGLKAHKKRHLIKNRPFKCDLCHKAFAYKTILETHIRIHKGIRPFKCQYCALHFASEQHLKKHQRQHTQERPFKCDFCNKSFFTSKLLELHRSKHTGDKKFSCSICGNKFITASTLKDHMLLHNSERPYQCRQCQKEFASERTLKKHVQIHNTENPLICEFCGKHCPAPKYLKSHMKTHTGYERHKCDVCGKGYRDPRYLEIHKKGHTGQGMIQCDACGIHFADPTYLKLHQKKHCKARKEHCNVCGLGLANKNDLALHMGLHTGERPYGCSVCGKAYTTALALAEHSKRHDVKTKSHQCTVCFKRFYTAYDLQRHTKRTKCAEGGKFDSPRKPGVKKLSQSIQKVTAAAESGVVSMLPLVPVEHAVMGPVCGPSEEHLLTVDRAVLDSATSSSVPQQNVPLTSIFTGPVVTGAVDVDNGCYVVYDMDKAIHK